MRRGLLPVLPLMAGAALAWALGLLWAYSDAGVGIVPFLVGAYGAVFFTGVLALWWFFSQKPRRAPRAMRLVTPVCIGVVLLLLLAGEPPANPLFRLRFAASETALQDFVRERRARPDTPSPQWVGLFRVGDVEVVDDQVHLFIAPCGVVDRCGLAQVPAGEPRRGRKQRFTPLGGGWYHLVERF